MEHGSLTRAGHRVRVGLETTPRKAFASALDWPGWSRAGKTEEAALDALASYRDRFERVARAAGTGARSAGPLEVVQSLPGDATTAFGAPSVVFDADREPVTAADARRLASLLDAAWGELNRIAASAPEILRKGPRGGGRDRDAILEHVHGAHGGYVRSMGIRLPGSTDDLTLRAAMLEVLRSPSDGSPPPGAKWPLRYAARRVAWHALDHAWEIEDRSIP